MKPPLGRAALAHLPHALLAVTILAGDLIALVYNLTRRRTHATRFVLKATIVAVIAGVSLATT